MQTLVVDDDPAVAESHVHLLRGIGHDSFAECDPTRVMGLLGQREGIELVLLDVRMPRIGGIELLERIKVQRPQVGVIMATVVNDVEQAVEATKKGAYNYLLKPIGAERLERVVTSYRENRPKNLMEDPRFSSFITADTAFEDVFRRVKAFADTDVTVLIQGESGTGKELIARLIHSFSGRSRERFLGVNVAALAPSLFEAELFGHRKGSFTGAAEGHGGYFSEAGSGTLYLDEIGELALDQQKKLLRVIEEKKFFRIGESEERSVNARLVASTNQDLLLAVGRKAFREDLYYRLANHRIHLPPLRDRLQDIDLLSGYFLQKYCSQYGRTLQGFDPQALRLLKEYSYPGNVRELEGMISSAVLLAQGDRVTPEGLPPHVAAPREEGGDLEGVRRRAILGALAACDGNQTKAALRLGIARGTLNKYLRDLGSERPGGPKAS